MSEILTDSQSRYLYSTDASIYEEVPDGVSFPESREDIQKLVRRAQEEKFSITPRAGGTSLAGQATGGGVIMDISRHMNRVLQLDPDKRFAHVQPGVIRDTLNRELKPRNLQFGPDTSTTNRCMIGGMIGNNSTGSFSIKYGSTRDHIIEVEVVLSDGSTATFKPLTNRELEQKKSLDTLEGEIYRGMTGLIEEHRNEILDAYPHPDIIRRNTGYPLDALCRMQPFDPEGRKFNLAELLCGSEGTLALTTSARVNLVPIDPCRLLVIPQFESLREALEATVEAVKFDPAAVELVDNIVLDATKGNIDQRKNRFFLEGEPACILIIQFEGENSRELQERGRELTARLEERNYGYTYPIITEESKIERVWELRKAGLGLLMGLGSDTRTPTFVEDTAVQVEDLPEYIDEFRRIMDKYETRCVFYAHASVGELHLRPVVDPLTEEGLEQMRNMADEVADLVASYNGSLSGEHGDGRARSPYIEKVLGKEMMPLLKSVKELWDPQYIFNPGKIVRPKPIDEDLRFSPEYRRPKVETSFHWRREGSFADALELCNGAGVCRKLAESGGTMCPSYMSTKEEKDSTRGRANLFRQLFSGRQSRAFESEELRDALDLCLSCKACKSECPANVDMARMKAEFMNGWHRRNGISLSERFFGQAGTFYPWVSSMAPLVNWLTDKPVVKELMNQFLGIHPERSLPKFSSRPFLRRADAVTRSDASQTGSSDKVYLFVDLFTNFHEPWIAEAAVAVLEHLGYRVEIADFYESGRPQISKGLIDQVKPLIQSNIRKLSAVAEQGIPIVGLEPSEVLTFRDEYLDLCPEKQLKQAEVIAGQTYQWEEYMLEHHDLAEKFDGADELVHVHGHCHTKALVGMEPVMELLKRTGYLPRDLETGCCGMAGSFGYEAEHYKVSMDIGELKLFPELRKISKNDKICVPGFSCRHQIKDGVGRISHHPAELMKEAIRF